MIISMGSQAAVFLTAAGAGFIAGIIFDIFRIIRKVLPSPAVITYLQDTLFFAVSAIITFYIMLNKNFGEIRPFVIAGCFLGAVIYFASLSILVMKASDAIISFIKKLAMLIVRLVTAPLRLLIRLLKKPLGIFEKKSKKLLRKFANWLKIKGRNIKKEIKIITKKV
ncbi:MAG: spore cortex biosynthesis protein YabQ [Clostridiales bacterium]|jgi:spore cortex biosynthesis protein YabQ|nr:spore cortex biosynthesis protein YabQ [Clostridiales bacterium]